MFGTLMVAVAIGAAFWASTQLWGETPSNRRIFTATLLGGLLATIAWIVLSAATAIPDGAVGLLLFWEVGLVVLVVRAGRLRQVSLGPVKA